MSSTAKNTSAVKTSEKPKAAEAPKAEATKPTKETAAKKTKSPIRAGKPNPFAWQRQGLKKGQAIPKGITKATVAATAAKKGAKTLVAKKIRTSVTFHRPRTLRLPKSPKYPRVSNPQNNKLTEFDVLKHPLTTESAMKKIEESNTLVFTISNRSGKKAVKLAVKKLYDVKVDSVRTLVTPRGEKKAYVRLAAESDALDVANRIGII